MNTPDKVSTIAEIRRLAASIGMTVTLRRSAAGRGRRRNGEGTVFPRKDGLWIARLCVRGVRHQVTAAKEADCRRRLGELQRRLLGPEVERLPPPTEVGPDGREFVRLNSTAFRRWIYARDDGLCGICAQPVAYAEVHVDHIRPRIDGGNDAVSNLRITHPGCNNARMHQRKRPIAVP
jgi:HNH endonuclease